MSVDIEKFIVGFYSQKAAEEEQKQIKEVLTDATVSEIIEYNEAMAFALGLTRQEYIQKYKEPEATEIMGIAFLRVIPWEEASKLWNVQKQSSQFLQATYEEKGMKALRKGSRPGSTSDWSFTKSERRLIKELTKKPHKKKKARKMPWKEKITNSKQWQLALKAQERGVTVDTYVSQEMNTRPAGLSDLEKNPFDEDQ